MTHTGTTYTPTRITAAELVPGDIVLTPAGERAYAAYDVDVDTTRGHVTVWTAVRDQEQGQPERLTLTVQQYLTVARPAATGLRPDLQAIVEDAAVALAKTPAYLRGPLDRLSAAKDEHGHVGYRHDGTAACKCGWTPRRPGSSHARNSVGLHIAAAAKRADAAYMAEAREAHRASELARRSR